VQSAQQFAYQASWLGRIGMNVAPPGKAASFGGATVVLRRTS
jgi:hypothetical protein